MLLIGLFATGLNAQKKVGVNTSNPKETVDIHEANSSDTRTALRVHNPTSSDTSMIILSTGNPGGSYAKYFIGTTDMKMYIGSQTSMGTLDTVLYVDENGELYLRNLSGSANEAVFVDAQGRLYSQPPPTGGGGGAGSSMVNPNTAQSSSSAFFNDYANFSSTMTSGTGSFLVPVNVPSNVNITSITYYFYDAAQPIQMKCELVKRPHDYPFTEDAGFAVLSPVGSAGNIQSGTASGNINTGNSTHFFIKVSAFGAPWNSNHIKFFGAKVSYN